MTDGQALTHEFVEFIPRDLKDGVIYVSIPYATAIHKCCCGCGLQVTTPLSPAQWSLTFNGKTISLHPSIGNWNFPCKSHYWIKENRVSWARQWSKLEIADVQRQDAAALKSQFSPVKPNQQDHIPAQPVKPSKPQRGPVRRFFSAIFGGR